MIGEGEGEGAEGGGEGFWLVLGFLVMIMTRAIGVGLGLGGVRSHQSRSRRTSKRKLWAAPSALALDSTPSSVAAASFLPLLFITPTPPFCRRLRPPRFSAECDAECDAECKPGARSSLLASPPVSPRAGSPTCPPVSSRAGSPTCRAYSVHIWPRHTVRIYGPGTHAAHSVYLALDPGDTEHMGDLI